MSTDEGAAAVGEPASVPPASAAAPGQSAAEADAEIARYEATFDDEIAEAQAFERKLFWREGIAFAIVVIMVIVRELWLS